MWNTFPKGQSLDFFLKKAVRIVDPQMKGICLTQKRVKANKTFAEKLYSVARERVAQFVRRKPSKFSRNIARMSRTVAFSGTDNIHN
jgi:hypothetical protein